MAKTYIRNKVASLVVKVAIGSVIAVGFITLAALWIIRGNTIGVSGQLGDMAAGDSRAALEAQSTQQLLNLTKNIAALSDSHLQLVQNSVEMIAYRASEILNNPGRYLPNPAQPPNPANEGVMTVQVLWAENADIYAAEAEAAILGNIQSLLLNVINHNVEATTSYIGSEQGFIIIVDEDSHLKEEFFDPRERPWYQMAVYNNRLIWTDVFPDAHERGLAIVCAMPFHDAGGGIAGVAGVGTILDDLTELVIGVEIGESGFAFVLNESGQIIIHENIELDHEGNIIREDLLNSPIPDMVTVARAMVNGESGIKRITIEGREYFAAFSPLTTLPWSLGAIQEVAEVIAPALESGKRIDDMTSEAIDAINVVITTVIAALVFIIAMIVIVVNYASHRFSNTLTKPITALGEGVKEIAGGNLDHMIEINSSDEIEELGTSVNKMAAALKDYIANLKTVTADKERIGAELNIASRIQSSMLPCVFPAFPERPEFDIFATMIPAKEVGGDFYDFFLVGEEKLALIVADVSGKGVPAALFMVIAKTLLKNNAQYGMEPKMVFEVVNNLLCSNNEVGMFVTVFMGVMDIPTGKFTFVNAGHNPPLIRRKSGVFERLPVKPGFVLAGMDGMAYKQDETILHEGDTIFMYTDGATEAANPNNELYGDLNLIMSANNHSGEDIKGFLNNVMKDIDSFVDGAEQADDITLLVMRRKNPVEELWVQAVPENLYEVINFINTVLDGYGCSEKEKSQIDLVVEEIFANIAGHAYKPDIGGLFVRISVNNEIVMEFEDQGKPFNPLDKTDPDITLGLNQREVGGLGVFMVKQIMDTVEYRHANGKNILTIKRARGNGYG